MIPQPGWNRFSWHRGIADSKLPPTDKLVACMLLLYADKHGECWPAVKSLSAAAGKSERVVQRSLRSLAANGWLQAEYRRAKPGDWDTNLYILTMGVVTPTTPPGDAHDTRVVTPTTPKQSNEQSNEQTKDLHPGPDSRDCRPRTPDGVPSRDDEQTGREEDDVPQRYHFADMDRARAAVAAAAAEHLDVTTGRREENYLLRTLTRSGQRPVRRDLAAYAAAAFAAEPARWRGLLVSCHDNDGHAADLDAEEPAIFGAKTRAERCWETWPLGMGHIDFTLTDDEDAA